MPQHPASCNTATHVTPECPVELTTYGYYPNLTVNAFFVALFSLLCISQILIGTLRRTWTFLIALVIGTFGEAVGYGGRIIMHHNPWSGTGFKIQICCLVLAPSFTLAGIYLTLKHMVRYCGAQHSRLKPRLYPYVFIGCDWGAICLQAIGGGVAAAAGNGTNRKLLDTGDSLIVAGIAFQVATMVACGLLMADYFYHFHKAKQLLSRSVKQDGSTYGSDWEKNRTNPETKRNFRLFCGAVAGAFLTIFIRCVYRVPEMSGGWGNPLMRKENEFLLLDGMMIGLATTLLTVFHPGWFFEPMRKFKK